MLAMKFKPLSLRGGFRELVPDSFARKLSQWKKRRIAVETVKEIRMPNELFPVTLLENWKNVRRPQLDSWFSYFARFKATFRLNSNHSNPGEYPV